MTTTRALFDERGRVLGSMHLARVGAGVREAAPGIAESFELEAELVCEACIEDALALAKISDPVKSMSA